MNPGTTQGEMATKIIFMALGAVCGGLAGYLISDLIVYQIEERRWAQQRDNMEAEYEDKVISESAPRPAAGEKVNYAKIAVIEEKETLSNLAKTYLGESSLFEQEVPKKTEKIRVIGPEDWESFSEIRDKQAVGYFDGDGQYVLPGEELVDDPNRMFGPNAHLHFGEMNEDPDVVVIRNENLGVDFEITRVPMSYGDYEKLVEEASKEEAEESKLKVKRSRRAAKPKPKKVVMEDNDEDEE